MMGDRIPLPDEETRGGEKPGDWQVSQQIKRRIDYIKQHYGKDAPVENPVDGTGEPA